MDYFTNWDYTEGECCFNDCWKQKNTQGQVVVQGVPFQDYTSSMELRKLKTLKYFICPTTAADYLYCGWVNGQAVQRKYLAPAADGSKSKLIIDGRTGYRLYEGAVALCSFELRYPSTASYKDKITFDISKQEQAHIHMTLGELGSQIDSQ